MLWETPIGESEFFDFALDRANGGGE